jgi:hypothetical protein
VRGDLADTSYAALLAALGQARARGRLLLDGPDGQGAIVFWDGQVVDATSPAPRARLVERLVRAGRLPQEPGTVDDELLRRLRAEPVFDAVAELLSWRSGRYVVAPDPEDAAGPEPDCPRLSVAVLLEQTERRRARLDQLAWLLPSLEVIPVPATQVPLHLDPGTDAAALLDAIDGQRDAAALAHHLGFGGLEVLRLLAGLHALGQVDITMPTAVAGATVPATADTDDTFLFAAASQPTPDVPQDVGHENGQDDDGTDVAAFLRELSSLALGEEQTAPSARPRRKPSDDAPPAGGGAGAGHGTPTTGRPGAAESRREPESSRRRRGLFGRG